MQELLDYAASSQDEVCGLILNGEQCSAVGMCIRSPGITSASVMMTGWRRRKKEIMRYSIRTRKASQFCLVLTGRCRLTGLPWWLASDGKIRKYRPVPLLLGRKFEHGIMDCYTLFRDAYHLCGIDLPDFERTNGWWLRGENLYLNNMPRNGFYQVSPAGAQPGDVIIRQPFPGADPCHSMILLMTTWYFTTTMPDTSAERTNAPGIR
jgi:proteasome lid subunit RPN8/RPN11